ncbi:MAG: hypothetical protein ACAH83_05150 [Alphaproteobacteria bacterium]
MALPPELQDELKKIADIPLSSAIERTMEGHANLAAAKEAGNQVGMSNLFNSIMIASPNLADADRLARAYAKSLVVQGLVEEDKVRTLDWQTVFNNAAAKPDLHTAAQEAIDQAFKDARGGVLIVSEPYQCPPSMSPRDFAFANYSATAHLMEKMDEMADSFDRTFNDLYKKGKDLNEIDRQMSGKDFEDPSKPVVILIGRPFEMDSMLAEDPYPWDMRFVHKVGISKGALEESIPKQRPGYGKGPGT